MSNRSWRKTVLTISALVLLATLWPAWLSADDIPSGEKSAPVAREDEYPRLTLANCTGGEVSLVEARGRVATVLICLSTECPISNEYTPTLNRIADNYRPRGVNFIGLNPNAGETLEAMAAHKLEYKLTFDFLLDAGGKIAKQLRFSVTPEVCVYDSRDKLVYRGRIDDRYRARGGAAGVVAVSDLENALDEVIAGKEVTVSKTKPLGCPVQLTPPQSKGAPSADENSVTYSRHVAHIIQQHCQECHRKGGMGSFALETYEQAVHWADDIHRFTASGKMPPWKPVAGHGDFLNSRGLTDHEKSVLARWATEGCIEGNLTDLPAPRQFAVGWQLGTPDVVLEPVGDFYLDSEGRDEYRNFVLPLTFDTDKYLTALEVLPGNARVVHHVVVFLDDTGAAQKLDSRDPLPGYSSYQGFPGFIPSGGLGGWAPGNMNGRLPDGVARILPKNAAIVMQVHYHKSGKPEVDRTKIGLYFAQSKVTRAVLGVPIAPLVNPLAPGSIPAGDPNYEVRAAFVMPTGGLALSVIPHMHLIGKDMRVTATLPNGTKRSMVYVDDWDFNWQEVYYYRDVVDLPAGTRLDLVAHFDNSDDNPNNLNHPPQPVRWGEQTTDEMCLAFIEIVDYREASDESALKLPDRMAAIKYILDGQAAAQARDARSFGERMSDSFKRLLGVEK